MQNKTISFRAAKKRHPLFLLLIAIIILALFPSVLLANADKIFKENNKAVVVVITYNAKGEPISQGSGFIVSPDGAVITNYHVISNAVDIAVKAGDKVLKVEGLLHIDKENDLVILKAKAKNLPFVKIGDINKINIGEKVYVISSPEGLENTISDGILSGIREITSDKKILQITAPVSSGSSGGPVFNKNGEVIGIATFIIKEAQNLNFAMPVNIIKDKISSKKIIALKDSKIEDYKKTADYWFYRGYYFAKAGLYKEALDAFKQAIKIEPDYVLAHMGIGTAYNGLRMHREAIESFKQAIRIKPDYAEAHGGLGIAYNGLRMHREAVEACKQAIKIKPNLEEAHYILGTAYFRSHTYIEAIESFRQAARIKPNYIEAHMGIGIAYNELSMHIEAIESFKQAIRIKPDYVDGHYLLGLTYMILNDRGSALEEYKILKNLDPELANELFDSIYK